MLVREDKNNTTRLIRINPTNPRVPPGGKFWHKGSESIFMPAS
jgi:hypothetical protein